MLTPERLRYRHRLLGFDDQWIESGAQRVASYTNLAPGPYRLEVEASVSELAPKRIAVEFSIAPLWWQRRSIQALFGALSLLLLALIWRARTTQIVHRSRELERLVATRTRDLQSKAQELAQADAEKELLVARLREQADAFERQAREDWLTGLPNRRAFEELLQQAFDAAQSNSTQLCVAVADIDHFKDINDRYSHAAGDQVLAAVAEEMRSGAGPGASIARWGGEEFTLLFPDCSREQALQRCERIRNAIATRVPFLPNGEPRQVTLSFGLAELDAEQDRPARLLGDADRRLYAAKNAGRNCIR